VFVIQNLDEIEAELGMYGEGRYYGKFFMEGFFQPSL
jgi:hypothetical protein